MKSENEDEKVDEVTACPDCKSTHLKRDYDHAEIVCADCGLVLEENINRNQFVSLSILVIRGKRKPSQPQDNEIILFVYETHF